MPVKPLSFGTRASSRGLRADPIGPGGSAGSRPGASGEMKRAEGGSEVPPSGVVLGIPDYWPEVCGYAPWVEEIWMNYISNALKYGGRPPVVELGAEYLPNRNQARFWVRDNGNGLTAEEQTRVFTPFTRMNQAKVEGHGLGLSVARRIAERLGGEVQVQSEVGAGSIFSFTLPVLSNGA